MGPHGKVSLEARSAPRSIQAWQGDRVWFPQGSTQRGPAGSTSLRPPRSPRSLSLLAQTQSSQPFTHPQDRKKTFKRSCLKEWGGGECPKLTSSPRATTREPWASSEQSEAHRRGGAFSRSHGRPVAGQEASDQARAGETSERCPGRSWTKHSALSPDLPSIRSSDRDDSHPTRPVLPPSTQGRTSLGPSEGCRVCAGVDNQNLVPQKDYGYKRGALRN